MTGKSTRGIRRGSPSAQEDKATEAEVGRIVSRALKEFLRELEEIPSITLEAPKQASGTEERVREIAARLFKRG
ncbi:MAG: hypothetical protein ABIG98_06995 [Chloroflexota bacterium]